VDVGRDRLDERADAQLMAWWVLRRILLPAPSDRSGWGDRGAHPVCWRWVRV